jgi:hypothetical protein
MKKPILEILLNKFPAREYALMSEVRDAAGFGASRSADYLIMGLWPSRGLDMIGIERKSYRVDWLSELKKPEKAENIYQYCDRWYLLTDNENVAKIEEIPTMWGWYHIDEKGKFKIIKEAPKLNPLPISKSFLACILKRASCKDGYVTHESINDKIIEAKQTGLNERDYHNKSIIESFQTLKKEVGEFEEITGIKLNNPRWGNSGKKLGEWVTFLSNGGVDEIKKSMTFIKNYHISIGKKINQFDEITETIL